MELASIIHNQYHVWDYQASFWDRLKRTHTPHDFTSESILLNKVWLINIQKVKVTKFNKYNWLTDIGKVRVAKFNKYIDSSWLKTTIV